MSPDDDRPGFLDRDKKSFSELDRMRREGRSQGERPPRGPGAEARVRDATKQYLKQIDGLFAKDKGGAEGERLARAMRDAHGTPELADACRAYLDGVGLPRDPSLLALLLDSDDPELIRRGLAGLAELREAGELEARAGLRSQLRMLLDHPDDDVADEAEALLETL